MTAMNEYSPLDEDPQPPPKLVRVCAWCWCVESADHRWVPIDESQRIPDKQKVTHCICPRCEQQVSE